MLTRIITTTAQLNTPHNTTTKILRTRWYHRVALLLLLHSSSIVDPPPLVTALVGVSTTAFVADAIRVCYPPEDYGVRRAVAYDAALASSSTTYTAEGIPLAGDDRTYGEFDLDFFARVLGRTCPPRRGDTFVDIGSGAGRLVLAAALLYPNTWANCHGVEISSPLHDAAIAARVRFGEERRGHVAIAPCQYTLSDFAEGEGLEALRSADTVFSYAVTWNHDGAHRRLVDKLADNLQDGARVISVDLPLSHEDFTLEAKEVGYNEETGSQTVAFVYRRLSRVT